MKKRLFKITILFFSVIMLNGCIFETSGDSLQAFSQRMNNLNEEYNITAEGYIINTEKCTLTKFFRFSQDEVMLNFKYDKKHRLNEMNIVFESQNITQESEAFIFICNCIKSFCHKEKAEEIFEKIDFFKVIKEIKKETTSAETDNIKIEIDTTGLGTVITVYKDI